MAIVKGKIKTKTGDILYPQTSADKIDDLARVAISGSYNDLSNKPTIPTVGTLNTTATTAQSTSASESLSGAITLHQVAKTGNADSVDNYHMTTYGYNYKGFATVTFRRNSKGTLTMAELNALTTANTQTGDIYVVSDDNNNEYCALVRSGALSWSKLTAPGKDYVKLEDNDAPIYIKIHSKETYASSFVDFYIAPSYDNVAGSTEIREYCRATNVYYANAVNYNGNKLVGIFQGRPGTAQASANTDYWYLKLSKHAGTYTAMPSTYTGSVAIYMNQEILSAELIQPSHAEYQYVSNYSYFTLPTAGIRTSSTVFNTINGVTVGTTPKFTDANVLQEGGSTNANYNVLFRAATGNTSSTDKVRYDSDGTFNYNPSTNVLSVANISATSLNGVTIGNSPKFTDTTYTLQTDSNAAKGEIKLTPSVGIANSVYLQGSGSTMVYSNNSGTITIQSPVLATVATTGNYNDLTNLPTIPDVSNFVERNELASVATTGSYTDLLNKPSIIADVTVNGSSVVNVNHIATVSVPTQTSDLTNNSGFITNATDSLQNYTKTSDLATVATSGAYNDLSGKPSLATVATSGDYGDLINKPPQELFVCTYGTTTYQEITNALAANKLPVCLYNNVQYVYSMQENSGRRVFSSINNEFSKRLLITSEGTWGLGSINLETTYYKVQSLSSSSTTTQYPSAKATYDAIEAVRELAEGRKRTIVCSDVANPVLNSQSDDVSLTTLTDIGNVVYSAADLQIGDTVYVRETDVPDRWVSRIYRDSSSITDLTGTRWVLHEAVDSSAGFNYAVAFTVDGISTAGTGFRIDVSSSSSSLYYYGISNTAIATGDLNTITVPEQYRDITFTGGPAVTTSAFITWLRNNAELMTGTACMQLSKLETAKVSVTDVQVNSTSVVNSNGVANIALAGVATSGDYGDLVNKPVLASVALTGDYSDLLNTPTIPDISNKVDKVTSTDNAIVRFDGTTGAVQNNTHVTIDDNGDIKTDKAIILSGITGSISTGTSRLYFGNSTSDYKSYLASNTSGAFSLASANGSFTFYANTGGYNCLMTSCGSDLGRNNNDGSYAWKDLYTKGSIYRHKTGSSGWYTFNFPTKSGTFALVSDIPTVNYPVTSVNGQTGAVVLSIPNAPGTLNTTATTAQTTSDSESLSGAIVLHKVSKTGSYTDLNNLPTLPEKLSDLGEDSDSIHVSQTQAVVWNAKQNALTFDSTPTANSGNPVTSGGVHSALQGVIEIAEGKTSTYVVSDVTNPSFDSQNDSITLQSGIVDTHGTTIALSDFHIGDIIYVAETDVPDRWVSSITTSGSSVTAVTCFMLETEKVPVTDVRVNGASSLIDGVASIIVPTVYLKSVTTVDKKSGTEIISPNNILRITKENGNTFDYEANSLKFKDFSANQEADANNKTINLNLSPYNQAGIWYTVASATIAKMANAPGNVTSGECMLENRPLGSTRYSYQIFTHKAGTEFGIWQRVQNNTGNWGNWQPAPTCPVTSAAGTTISTSDTEYLASITTNGKKLYRTSKKVSDFVTTGTSQNVNGTKTFTVDQILSNNRALKWYKADGTTVSEMLKLASDGKFYVGNSGVDLVVNNTLTPSANTNNLGSSSAKWGDAYINGKVYTSTLNNGADVTVPTTSGTLALLSDLSGFLTADTTALENYSTTNSFDDVAFSGSYNDLSDTPTIPTNADYVDLTTTQSIGGQKTFTANRMYINGETHFNAGGNPTDYAYGQAVGIYGKAMMCNTLYVPVFKYRTSAMNTAGKSATTWNLPNLDSGSTYTLATTSDLTGFITKSVNDLDNYTLTSNLATVATSGSYNDLANKPTIPTVNNATLTIQKNGATVDTFTANSATNTTVNITVPTTTNELTNNSGFITSSDIPLVFTDYVIPTT